MRNLPSSMLAELRQVLATRREALASEIHDQLTQSGATDAAGLINQLAATDDDAIADYLAEFDLAMLARDIREMRDVDAALARIDDGSYGVCADCGETIRSARLRAFPVAKRCIACQTAREKAQGRGAPARL